MGFEAATSGTYLKLNRKQIPKAKLSGWGTGGQPRQQTETQSYKRKITQAPNHAKVKLGLKCLPVSSWGPSFPATIKLNRKLIQTTSLS